MCMGCLTHSRHERKRSRGKILRANKEQLHVTAGGCQNHTCFLTHFCTLFLDTIFWGCCIASWMQRIVCIRFEHTVNIQSPYSHHTIIIQLSYSQHVAKSHESLCLVHDLLVRGAPIRRSSCHDFLTRLALFSHSTWFGFSLDLGVCFLC